MQGINPVLQLYHLIIRRRLLWVRPRVLLMELLVLLVPLVHLLLVVVVMDALRRTGLVHEAVAMAVDQHIEESLRRVESATMAIVQ